MIENILAGFLLAIKPINLIFSSIGVVLGIIVGAIPGLGPSLGIAILVPITFLLSPETGMLMLIGIFCGSVYGGSITAILLRIPGHSAAIVTVWDGNALARKGYPNKALAASIYASFIGGLLSAIALLFFSPLLAQLTLLFGPPEYVALAILGLTVIGSLEAGSFVKGMTAGFFGLLIATVGISPQTGFPRFTFDIISLYDGVPLVPVLIGIFCIPEVVSLAKPGSSLGKMARGEDSIFLSWRELAQQLYGAVRSGIIGVLIGVLPGAGGTIATFVAYDDSKRRSKTPEKYGTGILDGIFAGESSNNGASASSLVPLLTLGIPGSAAAVVFMGALTMHGLRPGPMLFHDHAPIAYSVLVGTFLMQFFLFACGLFGARIFAQVTRLSSSIIIPAVTVFSVIGAYGINSNVFDIYVMVIFGIIGTLMKDFKYSRAALVLGLVLGPMLEENIVRSLAIGHDSPLIFITRPISIILYILTILMTVGLGRKQKSLKR